MEHVMAKILKSIRNLLHISFSLPPEMFSICGGDRRYKAPTYSYPTCQEAWAQDWANIGMDFRNAVGRFKAELV
jgi:hypothetical protein